MTTFAAIVLAFLGAVMMAVSGEERVRGETYHALAFTGLFLIGLSLALIA